MARVEVPVKQMSRTGVEGSAQVAGSGEGHFLPFVSGHVFLEVQNADAAATHKITVTPVLTVDGQEVKPIEVTVAKSKTVMIGPWPPAVYQQTNGQFWFSADSAELKIRAWSI